MPEERESVANRARIVSFDEARSASSRSRKSTSARSGSSNRKRSRGESPSDIRKNRRTNPSETGRTRFTAETEPPLSLSSERIRSHRQVDDEQEPVRQEGASRERRRRERNKARADKMFDKQFASERAGKAETEGAPRAALYEGKMGSKHRKSSRMQQSASAGAAKAKAGVAELFSGINVTSRLLKVGTAVACVILACVFLYTPAQQYYQAQREHDRLAAEYESIEQRNDKLDTQNDALASDAGLEDAVRQKYGYVKAGEEELIVTGLSESATDTSRDSENVEASVLSSSVKAPEEWYTPFLDALFGVE